MEKETVAFSKCWIEFDNNESAIYFAGNTVSGAVNITLKEAKKYRGVVLKVKGWSNVNWTERRNKTNITHAAHEVYFKTYINLMAEQDNQELAFQYTPGLHKFYFSFTLPTSLPCSYEGTYGHTRYELKVTVKRPYRTDSCYRTIFRVISLVDLNQIPEARIPITISKSESYYFLFSKLGIFKMAVEIPVTGFTCGETIQIKCILNNQSKIKMEQLHICLMREIVLVTRRRAKRQRKNILGKTGGPLDKKENQIKILTITLPGMPLTSQNYCSIIRVGYSLKVKAIMEGIHDNIKFEFPIIIGSIPLTDLTNYKFNVPLPLTSNSCAPSTSNSCAPSPMEPQEPPSYEEATMGEPSQSIKNDCEEKNNVDF